MGKSLIETSRDGGKTWRDITGNSFGYVSAIFSDPDHPGLVCLETNSIRNYILQAEDQRYLWKPIRSWVWSEEHPSSKVFGRAYWTTASNNPLYMFRATLRNYFDYDFGSRSFIGAIDLTADQERFVFRKGEAVVVPITIRFLDESNLVREKLVDHPTNFGIWGLNVEFGRESKSREPSISKQMAQIREDDFAARIRGEPGRRQELEAAFVRSLKEDAGWKVVDLTAAQPYRRTLDIGKLHDFSKAGNYYVQLVHDNTSIADRSNGQWVGRFSSAIFTITIEPEGNE
jgi:hypothetical protein